MENRKPINTGKMISDHCRKFFINKTQLAARIGKQGQSITKYGHNSTIQTAILLDLSYALQHNFFQDIANTMPSDFTVNPDLSNPTAELIKKLQEENNVLKIQNEVLMKIRG